MPVHCHFSELSITFNDSVLFQQISGTLTQQNQGLTGINGCGKSVLMSLLALRLRPSTGTVDWQTPFFYVPQLTRLPGSTLADALGIADVQAAFQRVENGSADVDDYDFLADKWNEPHRWQSLLDSTALGHLSLESPSAQLSGGEQTRLALCRAFLQRDSFLLLDEPENHLDSAGRRWLIAQLQQHPSGSLSVSHDRQLLNEMQRICELSSGGLMEYGGNYSDYALQKERQLNALRSEEKQLQSDLRKEKEELQRTLEKKAQRCRQGDRVRSSGSQSLLLLDMKKNKAEKQQSKITQRHERVMDRLDTQRRTVNERIERITPQMLEFPYTDEQKRVRVNCQGLILPFGSTQPHSLTISGGEHWQIAGRNGSGKSTLLKVLTGQLVAASGNYSLHGRWRYLDQHLSLLNSALPVVDALCEFDPLIPAENWRTRLGALRIRGDKSLIPLGQLSGGEQLKVMLLALTCSSPLPDILLLDEPDNHLDLESRQLLEGVLKSYKGALLLVSHDEEFVKNCGVTQTLEL
ncbi:ATP-binding cassette domain-containing protein [Erwinia sp. JUb26]|uniref:ATP-binding cassette domain-containing protein n=1 Tax=Erwinia sp. JUb26 TaxID=2485126 RepID=UPI000F467CFA|nr:ATP-binding cassette domain-containing protein [Erwinia sp. JUb26]ROR15098.1 ATPase subunit of ABC transporter with duplicated ATPase domains [Erwinia sp. JUb26]